MPLMKLRAVCDLGANFYNFIVFDEPDFALWFGVYSMPASEGPEGRQNQQALGGYEAAS